MVPANNLVQVVYNRKSISGEAYGRFNPQEIMFKPIVIAKSDLNKEKYIA